MLSNRIYENNISVEDKNIDLIEILIRGVEILLTPSQLIFFSFSKYENSLLLTISHQKGDFDG